MQLYASSKIFKDRKDAGQKLAGLVKQKLGNTSDLLVLGIPRGGVEVAFYVAESLKAPMSVLVAKKLPYPGQEEVGFGAVAERAQVFISSLGSYLDAETIGEIMEQQLDAVDRRVKKYRNGKELPDMKGKTIVLIDDGIATGATLIPAIKCCKLYEAAKVIVAAPVSGTKPAPQLKELADDIIVFEKPETFHSVSQFYHHFSNLSDQQVTLLLQEYAKIYPGR